MCKWVIVGSELCVYLTLQMEAQGEEFSWSCSHMRAGATCRSSAGDWASAVRASSKQRRQQACPLDCTCAGTAALACT